MKNFIKVMLKSYQGTVGSTLVEYTKNEDGSINLVGTIFGNHDLHVPQNCIYFRDGAPEYIAVHVSEGLQRKTEEDNDNNDSIVSMIKKDVKFTNIA